MCRTCWRPVSAWRRTSLRQVRARGRSELISCNWSLRRELLAPPLFTPAPPCVNCVFAASPTQPLALLVLPPVCAVVSNDVRFVHHILGSTVNGTTYAGIRGRTTGTDCCTAAWLHIALALHARCCHESWEPKLSWGPFQALKVLLWLNASHLIAPAAPAAHPIICRCSAEPLVRALLLSVILGHVGTRPLSTSCQLCTAPPPRFCTAGTAAARFRRPA